MRVDTPDESWNASSAFIRVDHLIAACNAIGITLRECSEGTSLYIWAREGRALYIGKKSTKNTRIALETALVAEPNLESLELGFSRAMWRNGARAPIQYSFDDVDHELLAHKVAQSKLHGFELALAEFQQKKSYINTDVEKILIRVAVQGGYALYNSSDAGQWESKWEALDEMLAFVILLQSQGTNYDLTRGLIRTSH